MLRDVVERHEGGNVTALKWLVRHLLGNPASMFSVEKFHRTLRSQGVAVSRDTLHDLLGHLQDCFLVRTVWMESASERQRMVNPRKVYPIDPGLVPLFDRTGRSNLGHLLESVVLIELERRHAEVAYVRTASGLEVDFLARYPDRGPELIQVCTDATDARTLARELRTLDEAGREHRGVRATLITATAEGLPERVPARVAAIPAHTWLLSKEADGRTSGSAD